MVMKYCFFLFLTDREGTDFFVALDGMLSLLYPLRDTLILGWVTNRSKDSWENGLQLILELIPLDLSLITQNMTSKRRFNLIVFELKQQRFFI